MSEKSIAFLGTGIMGLPMARNLALAGVPVRVWNRTASKADSLGDVATTFKTIAEAVANADVIVTMLHGGTAVTEVMFGAKGAASAAKANALFVDMSSIQPALARDHSRTLAKLGFRHLDAPVSGGEKGAVDGTLAIMAGGTKTDFADMERHFGYMGQATHVGIAGAGQVAKLANQMIVAVSIGAVSEALLLAQEGGCEPASVRKALMGGFANSRILELHGQRMIDRDWMPGGPLEYQLKDLDAALEVAKEAGLKLALTEQTRRAFFDLTNDMNMPRSDHAAYLLWLEAQNPDKRLGLLPDRLP